MKRLIARFYQDTQASVLIIFAFLTFFLVAVAGAGVDMGRSQIIRHKMHQASDAAALAGASMAPGVSQAERDAVIERTFRLNFPDNFMGSTITAGDMVVTYTPNGVDPQSINIKLTSEVETTFMRVVGYDKVDIGSETEVGVVASAPAPADIVMTLDISGSMGLKDAIIPLCPSSYPGYYFGGISDSESRIYMLRNSVNNFIDTLLEGGTNPSPTYSLATVLYGRDDSPGKPATMIEQVYDNDLNSVRAFYLAESGTGYLVPISGDGTKGGTGALHAKARVDTTTRPYGPKDSRVQAVIFMTDGRNMRYRSTPHPVTGWNEEDDPTENALFSAQCSAMKGNGVQLYTIAFGEDVDCYSSIATMLYNCASGNTPAEKSKFYYKATTGHELDDAFQNIASSIKAIRIVK